MFSSKIWLKQKNEKKNSLHFSENGNESLLLQPSSSSPSLPLPTVRWKVVIVGVGGGASNNDSEGGCDECSGYGGLGWRPRAER